VRGYNLTKPEEQNKKADGGGHINKSRPLFTLYNADNSGNKGSHTAASGKEHRDGERQVTEECFAAPLSRSHEDKERCEKQKEGNNQPHRPFAQDGFRHETDSHEFIIDIRRGRVYAGRSFPLVTTKGGIVV
jgi:hypothetical protein